jgi:hypothetical protein
MAFCTRCGTSMSDTTTVCPNCGQVRGVSGFAPASAAPPPPGNIPGGGAYGIVPPPAAAPGSTGFLGALFDFSFSSFVTTKLIKVLYVLGVIIAGFAALMLVIAGFTKGVLAGMLVLIIVAPLVFFLYVIYWRVIMELIIVVFRATEDLGELVRQGRRTAGMP